MKKRNLNGISDDSLDEGASEVTEQIMNVYNSGVVIPSAKLDENEQEVDNLKK